MDTAAKGVRFSLLVVELTLSVVGNLLMLAFIKRSRQLRRSPSLNFILSCGAADSVSAIITIPFAMDYFVFRTRNLFGYAPTTAYAFSLTLSTILTLSAIMLVLIDRILIVKYPIKYLNKMTVRRARQAIILMWVSVFVLSIILTTVRLLKRPPLPNEGPIKYYERLYEADGFVGACVPPAVITTVVVIPSAILYRLINKRRQANRNPEQPRSQSADAGERKITASCRTVLAVMVVYLVSYFPVMIINILHVLHVNLPYDMQINKEFYAILFLQLSSVVNPLLFILRSSTIRRSAARVLPITLASHDHIEIAILRPNQ